MSIPPKGTPADPTPAIHETASTRLPDDAETVDIPVREETLAGGTRRGQVGEIHIHKGVEATEQSAKVPLYHEEAVVEHIPADKFDANAPRDPDEIVIPVIEERLIVQKQAYVREYVRIRKSTHSKQYEVKGMVRRETVDVTRDNTETGERELLYHTPSEGAESAPPTR